MRRPPYCTTSCSESASAPLVATIQVLPDLQRGHRCRARAVRRGNGDRRVAHSVRHDRRAELRVSRGTGEGRRLTAQRVEAIDPNRPRPAHRQRVTRARIGTPKLNARETLREHDLLVPDVAVRAGPVLLHLRSRARTATAWCRQRRAMRRRRWLPSRVPSAEESIRIHPDRSAERRTLRRRRCPRPYAD